MNLQKKRCWAEVSLDNIEHNYRALRNTLPQDCRFLGVVKANAYGHGAVQVAQRLEQLGADYLAVAFLDEALELREHGITLPVLILGYTAPEYTEVLIRHRITQAVADEDTAKAYAAAAQELGAPLKCHLKLDSGMGRLGFPASADVAGMAELLVNPYLEFEGVFTHFAVSDVEGEENRDYTLQQFETFTAAVRNLETLWGKKFSIIHCANSGAVLNYPHSSCNMVRPGILLYGHDPDGRENHLDLRPAMTLKARVVQLKDVQPGTSVSYGRLWKADKPCKVAVLSIGYADGLSRNLSGRAEFLLRGQRIRQVGRICMDMCMADVSEVEQVQVGDEVLIFGSDASGSLPVEEHCAKLSTISYELLCDVSARVPRVYTTDVSE